ncbi:MAG: type II toxin-antitoxin system VapC family toxin [Chloroflexota bacterium]|nr:type II toxin-antitoxin system VapC family toxin [Chloroflexota bacterium]
MLIDSNIIIYAARPEYSQLRQFIAEHGPFVSAVSYVEVLGYHKLVDEERALLEAFFTAAPMLSLAQPVLDQAIKLRQLRKMTLGDALIAGTALTHHLTLVTRNSADFTWIAGLTVLNPFDTA